METSEYEYFENKKRTGLILTAKNINPAAPLICMYDVDRPTPVTYPNGPDFWSKKSHRYRTKQEQVEFIKDGCVDRDLGKMPSDWLE